MAITTQQRTQLIELYVAILDRAPAQSGLNFWSQVFLDNGSNLQYVANEMWNSAGAQADYPAFLTTSEIVAEVFQNVFGRAPAASGLAFWTAEWNANGPAATMIDMIENINTNPSTDPQFLLDKALFQNKVAFGEWYAVTEGLNDPAVAKAASELITSDPASIAVAQAFVDTDPAETVILTSELDVVTTGNNDDRFLATSETLNSSDELDGGLGDDILELTADNDEFFFTAPEISNIETISVTAGGSAVLWGDFDLSDADGYNLLEVKENEELYFDWSDIQDVINTDLRIEDTDYGWIEYNYDTNAYLSLGGGNDDIVNLELAEVDCLDIYFDNETGSTFGSDIDQLNINSTNVDGINNPSLFNYVYELYVGSYFDTLVITGDTDLTIEKVLNIGTNTVKSVNASALTADLNFDIEGQGAVSGVIGTAGALRVAPLSIVGAQGNNDITVDAGDASGRDGVNGVYTTFAGSDSLVIGDMEYFNGSSWDGEDCHDDDPEYVDCEHDVYGDSTINTAAGVDTVIVALHGEQNINTGADGDYVAIHGNTDDILTSINGDGASTIKTEGGNDLVETFGDYANYDINLGDGNDALYMEGCDGEDDCAEGDVTLDAGAGNDYASIAVLGDHDLLGGTGADTFDVGCDCEDSLNVTVDMGADNDVLTITGSGLHDITLGTGNDILYIVGEASSTSVATSIDAGEGNDYVSLTGDARLDLEMGTGADTLVLTAEHLESQDSIDMGDGIDRIVLHNGAGADDCDFGDGCGSLEVVRLSETSHTSSVEVFDLRNGNIELHLTTGLFQTAFESDITVITELSERQPLPTLTYLGNNPQAIVAFEQGMSREDWESIVEDWQDDLYAESNGPYATFDAAQQSLLNYLLSNGVTGIDFDDTNGLGLDDVLYTSGSVYSNTVPGDIDDDGIPGDDEDEVFFRVEDCEQTVDVTEVDFSLVPDWHFTLLGGNVRDIIIANDDFISGDYVLRFDSAGSDAESVIDTLVVRGGADITDMDEEQITGLECIILQSDDLVTDLWEIDLTEAFVSQTTGNADLDIIVDTNVIAGSKLYLTTQDLGNPTNNVRVFINSNVTLYIDGAVATPGSYGPYITVINELLFTTNSDNLIGTNGDDVFIATSADQVDGVDKAEGNNHVNGDELHLHFGVFNSNASLSAQLDNPQISEIEIIRFLTPEATQKAVEADRTYLDISMEGVGIAGVQSLYTGYGNDFLDLMEDGIHYFTGAGADTITLDNGGGHYYVHGGEGNDSVTGGTGNDSIHLGGVESVSGNSGNDYIVFDQSGDGDDSGNAGNTYIHGNGGEDTVQLDNDGTSGVAFIDDVEYVYGGSGADTMDIDVLDGDGQSVWAGSGNDSVDVDGDATSNTIYVEGESGNDTIRIHDYNGDLTVYGDDFGAAADGADSIYVDGTGADDDADITSIFGEGGNDYIYFTNVDADGTDEGDADMVDGGTGNDTIYVVSEDDATVVGGTGADSIVVTAYDDVYATGDSDNDIITVTQGEGAGGGAATVLGGDGNDTITVNTDQLDDTASITGGQGDDSINLSGSITGGVDRIVFGNIVYNNLQVISTNSQTAETGGLDNPLATDGDVINNFNWEAGGPGLEDTLDFSAFLGFSIQGTDFNGPGGGFNTGLATFLSDRHADWTGGNTTVDMENGGDDLDAVIAVIAVDNGRLLSGADISEGTAGTIQIDDGGRAVVIFAMDTDGDSNYDKFDVYFVQDVDSDAGTAWAVDKVATINSITEIGAINDTTLGDNHWV